MPRNRRGEPNLSNTQRNELTGCRPSDKTPIAGATDRSRNKVAAKALTSPDKDTPPSFPKDHFGTGWIVCTNGAKERETLAFDRDTVSH